MAPDYEFRPAWGLNDPELMHDAKEFWRGLGLLGPMEIERRASELIMAAYHEGKVVAVTTATISHVDQLRARCVMYRCAVAPEHRRHHVAYQISGQSRALLEKWSLENPHEEVVGMGAFIQASELKSHRTRELTWPDYDLNLNFVGYNTKGEQLRVAWFKHALLPPIT